MWVWRRQRHRQDADAASRLTCMSVIRSSIRFLECKQHLTSNMKRGCGRCLCAFSIYVVACGPWLGVSCTYPACVARLNCFRPFATFAMPRLILEEFGTPSRCVVVPCHPLKEPPLNYWLYLRQPSPKTTTPLCHVPRGPRVRLMAVRLEER